MVFRNNMRPDGRGLIDTRPADTEAAFLRVPHGSSLLTAGDTQVLSTVTVSGAGRPQEGDSPHRPSQCIVHFLSPTPASSQVSNTPKHCRPLFIINY